MKGWNSVVIHGKLPEVPSKDSFRRRTKMNNVCSLRRVLLLSAVLLSVSALIYAQSDLGSISGFVKDPSGASIPNAKVVVRNQSGSVERQATTNEAGYYTITNIPPGLYSISVEVAGFKRFESRDNKLDPAS